MQHFHYSHNYMYRHNKRHLDTMILITSPNRHVNAALVSPDKIIRPTMTSNAAVIYTHKLDI